MKAVLDQNRINMEELLILEFLIKQLLLHKNNYHPTRSFWRYNQRVGYLSFHIQHTLVE